MRWGPDVDKLPEFDFDSRDVLIIPVAETTAKSDGRGGSELSKYYPGFTLRFTMVRNPFSKIMKIFLPCIVIAILNLVIFSVDIVHTE